MVIPQHVAIILDGNGRWAKSKGMPRNYGHSRGAKNLEVICEDAWNMGIKYLTVYLFSTENWKRSKEEVDGLMRLFRSYTKTCIKKMCIRDRSYLGATQAPYYVRRNFTEIKNHGIHLDGAYLDVFTCNEGDECDNPRHRMSRKECYENRKKCFDFLISRNILPSSEDVYKRQHTWSERSPFPFLSG